MNQVFQSCSADILLTSETSYLLPSILNQVLKSSIYKISIKIKFYALVNILTASKSKIDGKHSPCSAFIVGELTFIRIPGYYGNLLENFLGYKYNPNYAIIFSLREYYSYESHLLFGVKNSMLSSIFYRWVIHSDSYSTFGLYCIPCAYEDLNKNIISVSSKGTLQDVNKIWKTFNKNMRGAPIHPFPPFTVSESSEVCHPYITNHYNTIPFVCVSLLTEEYFNGSITFIKNIPMPESFAQISNYVVGNTKLIHMFLNPYRVLYEWIPIGTTYKPFHFIIFTRTKSCTSDSFLLSPFRPVTWILISFAIVCISVVIWCNIHGVGKHRISYVDVTLWVAFLLIDKSSLYAFSRGELSKIKILVLLWIFSSFVLKSAYESSVYSSLTTGCNKHFPQTFQELLASDIPLYTDSKQRNAINGLRSYLKASIIPSLLDPCKFGENECRKLSDLRDETMLLQKFGADNILELKTILRTRNATNAENGWNLTDTFALIDDLATLQSYSYNLEELKSERNSDNPIYTIQSPWIVTRSFFASSFLQLLHSFVESGIYSFWKLNEGVHEQEVLKRRTDGVESNNIFIIPERKADEKVKVVSFFKMYVPLLVYGTGTFVAVLVAIGERIVIGT